MLFQSNSLRPSQERDKVSLNRLRESRKCSTVYGKRHKSVNVRVYTKARRNRFDKATEPG